MNGGPQPLSQLGLGVGQFPVTPSHDQVNKALTLLGQRGPLRSFNSATTLPNSRPANSHSLLGRTSADIVLRTVFCGYSLSTPSLREVWTDRRHPIVNSSKTNGVGSGRSTKRINLRIPVTVSGRDEHGSVFADQVLMENVSREGGCFWFTRDLSRRQSFRIEGENGARFLAHVRWCIYYARRNTRRVGFQLDQASKNGWVIDDIDNV